MIVTLEHMLVAREWRAKQQRIYQTDGKTLISLTLNIPGENKRPPLSDACFSEAKAQIEAQLDAETALERVDEAGHFALFLCDLSTEEAKRIALSIEDDHPLGRLMDIDIFDENGNKLSRQDSAQRCCLVCGAPAHACARSRAHKHDTLFFAINHLLRTHFAGEIGSAATEALQCELDTTPKPGLVDRRSSGAHRDMDYALMKKSITALEPHFFALSMAGMNAPDVKSLYTSLSVLGQAADRDMMRSTGNINTHRGSLFSLGLIAGACGLLQAQNKPLTIGSVLDITTQLGALSLKDANLGAGRHGARMEAAQGFPSVKNIALPTLQAWLPTAGANDAGVIALLHLVADVRDTNLVARSDEQSVHRIQSNLMETLEAASDASDFIAIAEDLNKQFVEQNLSPGGCADLLAAAWMLHYLCVDA